MGWGALLLLLNKLNLLLILIGAAKLTDSKACKQNARDQLLLILTAARHHGVHYVQYSHTASIGKVLVLLQLKLNVPST